MPEPQTEAGRALLAHLIRIGRDIPITRGMVTRADIAAIEAEAAAAERVRIANEVEAIADRHRRAFDEEPEMIGYESVLRILSGGVS